MKLKLKKIFAALYFAGFELSSISSAPASDQAGGVHVYDLSSKSKYRIEIIETLQDGQPNQRLIVKSGRGKATRIILDKSEHNFAIVDPCSVEPNLGSENNPAPIYDLTGDGTKDLIIRTWSGGAHCCYTYDIYSLDSSFKHIGCFATKDGHMLTMKRYPRMAAMLEKPPVLFLQDATFRWWNNGVFDFPVVALRWNGKRFAVYAPAMKKKDLEQTSNALLEKWSKQIEEGSGSEFYYLLLKLYYSGRAGEAISLMHRVSSTEAAGDELHSEFIEQLKKSPYCQEVKALNGGLL